MRGPELARGPPLEVSGGMAPTLHLSCVIPGEPIPWMRPLSQGPRRFTHPKDKAHRELIALYAAKAMGDARLQPANSYMQLGALFYLSPPSSASKANRKRMLEGSLRPTTYDLDNLLKSVMDALRGVAFTDDRLVVELGHVAKLYSAEPRTEIRIMKL